MTEFPPWVLSDPSSGLSATFVPGAGMVASSLTHDGAELLGQRSGLSAYVNDHKTFGIPLLYPWANRLSGNHYRVSDTEVAVLPASPGVHTDGYGAPIHGTLAGDAGWQVRAQSATSLTAELDFGSRPDLLASFPFPHLLELAVTLSDGTLTLRTTVTATTRTPVPLCFGFHPYLQLPGVARPQWLIETPAMRSRIVDAHGLPTGQVEPYPAARNLLGEKVFDHGFDEVPAGAVFAVSGGGRRIAVRFDRGYPAAQIYAPADDDVICFEPMAAPTDALRQGGYAVALPGAPGVAQFSLEVS